MAGSKAFWKTTPLVEGSNNARFRHGDIASRRTLTEPLELLDISQNRLAKTTIVSTRCINEKPLVKRSNAADDALRIGNALGMTAESWLNLQWIGVPSNHLSCAEKGREALARKSDFVSPTPCFEC